MFIDHRYEVLEVLGTGAWARVYKVKDIRSDKLYTLKLFQYLSSGDFYANFSAELMHRITQIEHPNLINVVDFGHVSDHIYFVSEYFEGSTLANFRFSKGKLDQIYDIVVQISYALHALHSQDILHRDLKLENVLYRTTGNSLEVKVIDFGFSKVDQEKDKRSVSGSLPYIAPEVFLGKEPGPTADFYSLGVLLYKLCTQNFPFDLEKITAMMNGSQQHFIPPFPTSVNEDIPNHLERLILYLLEKNPENRFQSAQEIISYVNRTSGRTYPFSLSWSLANTLRFNSYMVRKQYTQHILDYIPAVRDSNGKIITLIGGDGLGKDNILSLFRYHLLGGEFFHLDYTCTRTDHEAFFALIKEYLRTLPEDKIRDLKSLANISDKFRSYLFSSSVQSKELSQNPQELKQDFEAAKMLIIELSRQKPIIFIIRNFQYVHRYTIDFINYFSKYIIELPILVILAGNDFNRLRQIENSVLIHVPLLTEEESISYMNRLLGSQLPEDLATSLYRRSAGNPHFIRTILVDLIKRKQIIHDDGLQFPENLDNYKLPALLNQAIDARMNRVAGKNSNHLQKLAIACTPLTRNLIMQLLKLKDYQLYSLLNDAIHNEILIKRGKNYYYTFWEAHQKYLSQNTPEEVIQISQEVLAYFKDRRLDDAQTCLGLIQNASMAQDPLSEREYYKKLYAIYNADFEQEKAYEAIINVLRIDFALGMTDDPNKPGIPATEMIKDLREFHDKTQTTGFYHRADFVIENADMIPEIFEKYQVLGTLRSLAEDIPTAMEHFKTAAELALTGRQKVISYLNLSKICSRSDLNLAKSYLDKIDTESLNLELKIRYVDQLAIYHASIGETGQAIAMIENFLADLPPDHDAQVLINLASIHNNLGVFYSNVKNIDEASEHLNIAMGIWKRNNIKRYLGLIYNNMADLYLKQGFTQQSLAYSQQGYAYSSELNLTANKALALLNQGEAYIKMGNFMKAEELLNRSRELFNSINSTRHHQNILRNLALAKSKIHGFGYYFKFIQEANPKLIEGTIDSIDPLVKTYFYYLHETANVKKLRRLIRKNVHINYKHTHQEEFYHNVQSMIALSVKDYGLALSELHQGMKFAGEVNNNYAIAVFNVMQISCYYGLENYEKARELAVQTLESIKEHQYLYWETKIKIQLLLLDMINPEIPLRKILRDAYQLSSICQENSYYQLQVELWQIRLQALAELGVEKTLRQEIDQYREFLLQITLDIDPEERESYLQVNSIEQKQLKRFSILPIASRGKDLRNTWNELLYNIANINSVERIKFLIEIGLNKVIHPDSFIMMSYSDRISNFYCFHCYNYSQSQIIPKELNPIIEEAFENDQITELELEGRNHLAIPLISGSKRIGYLILNDAGELQFTKSELNLLRNIKQHLTALLVRVNDYTRITKRSEKMGELIQISHRLMGIVQMHDLEQEIVSSAIDFTNATRGFLIKWDADGNNLYKVQMDYRKQILTTAAGVSKTALSTCQNTLKPVVTYNASEDQSFKHAISVQDYAIHNIFCCPILIDETSVAYLYLDNMGDSSREMYLKDDILGLFQAQLSIAYKNAHQYESILKKSREINEYEAIKDEFMAIVSHELNTPLAVVQGYVSRLKRNLYADEEEKKELLEKLESSVRKLILTTTDIMMMNDYNLTTSLTKEPFDISEILELVHHEVEILSRNRKMFIKIEVEEDLPKVDLNWEAIHRMVHNVVLNAIRFTNDFGTIVIGARRSVFTSEKINNRETLVIYVQDNGIGIPEYQLNNVFRKFFELNEINSHKMGTVEYKSSGLGLGLAMAKRIVQLHGGFITIKSKEQEGTTVFMILPYKDYQQSESDTSPKEVT